MFLITCFKYSQNLFNLFNYLQFLSSSTRSSHSKLKCIVPSSKNNHLNFTYFNRFTKLWNTLPIIDLKLSTSTLKRALHSFLWQQLLDKSFLTNHALGTSSVSVINVSLPTLPTTYLTYVQSHHNIIRLLWLLIVLISMPSAHLQPFITIISFYLFCAVKP